jgi:hypothetical protein
VAARPSSRSGAAAGILATQACLSGVRGRRPRPEFVFNVICLVGQLVPVPGIGVLLAAGAGFSSIAGYRFACFAQNTADFRQFC